jgi:hypothetical protein
VGFFASSFKLGAVPLCAAFHPSSFSLPAACWILPQKQIQQKDVLVLL